MESGNREFNMREARRGSPSHQARASPSRPDPGEGGLQREKNIGGNLTGLTKSKIVVSSFSEDMERKLRKFKK